MSSITLSLTMISFKNPADGRKFSVAANKFVDEMTLAELGLETERTVIAASIPPTIPIVATVPVSSGTFDDCDEDDFEITPAMLAQFASRRRQDDENDKLSVKLSELLVKG